MFQVILTFISFSFVGDCQIPLALKMFIDEKGKELLQKRLYRNFLLHCSNMHEYNILSPGQVFTAVTQLQRFIRDNNLQHHLSHWEDQLKKAFENQKPDSNLSSTTVFCIHSNTGCTIIVRRICPCPLMQSFSPRQRIKLIHLG